MITIVNYGMENLGKDPGTMKVAFYGNVCNNFYNMAKAFRGELNIDAHLYLNHKADFQHRPESDDPGLKDNYPDWIHYSEKWDPILFLKRFDRTFIRELNRYDVVFLSEFGVMLTPYLKARTLFYTTGGDLTKLPFPRKFSHEFRNIFERLKWEYFGFLQRRGIRHATRILTQPFYPFANALNELHVKAERICKCYFPILVDTKVITKNVSAREDIDPHNRHLLASFKFIIFHPARINLDQSRANIESGQWKGNDNLLKGFAIFLEKYKVRDACIAMPERIFSPDIPEAKQIIDDLGITENIVWLRPPVPQGFKRGELVNFYSISDLVAGEFAAGWFGSVAIEGTACIKPTFNYIDENVMRQLYPWHPFISVKEPEKIAEAIAEFYFDPEKKARHGELSRKWAMEFHSLEKGSSIYINNFRTDLRDIFDLAT